MSTPTTVPSDSVTLEPGLLVAGRYHLLARVGRGGSGSVWRAHDELLDRDVAIKRLHGGPALTDVRTRKIRDRAHREGRVAARLHHPRLAAIYDMTELDGAVCLVMEYVAAPSLADVLERGGPLPAARVATLGAQVAEGLAAMHRRGIVHRDVKPANIMVGPDDTVTITDFGIAIIHADLGEDDHLVAGTPHYMAPEVACGDVPTAAADMYSLGATLHAALEGAPPRPGAGHLLDVPSGVGADGVRRPGRDERLDPLLTTLLDPVPQRRPSAATTARLLAEARGGAATSGSPIVAAAPTPELPDDGGDAASPGGGLAPAGAGRHRAVLAARWRPSRRLVAAGAGLVGLLGAAGFLTLAHGPAPSPPVASPVLGPTSAPPSAGPPIVPLTPSTATSAPVEEVASAASPSSVSSRGTTAQAAGSAEDAPGEAPGNEGRGNGGGNGHGGGNGGRGDGEDKHDAKGNGNGRGHGG